jgi:glycopeptide antibiotics resistance protein
VTRLPRSVQGRPGPDVPDVPTTAVGGDSAAGPRARGATRAYLRWLFVVYLVLLVWIVLWKLEVPWIGDQRVIKLVPFAGTRHAGASTPLDVVVNLALFVPFGVYLGMLAPARRWWALTGIAAGASLALEVLQYVLGVGRSDVSDVVVNTAGAVLGLALLCGARRVLQTRSVSAMTLVVSVGTALALLATGLFLVSGVHLVHVRDVGPLSQVTALRRH